MPIRALQPRQRPARLPILAALAAALLIGATWGPIARAEAEGRLEILEAVDFGPYLPARTLRVYLPPGYDENPDRRWPVVYLHDGQNLFDEKTAYAGEWRVDETVTALVRDGKSTGWIVVGVDNGREKRMGEYAPWRFQHAPTPQGMAHAAALAERVKPAIDARYRTDPRPEATLVGGSSMGAVIALYTGLTYPDRFGGVLAMSGSWPEAWMMADLRRWMATLPPPPAYFRVWLDMGVREWGPLDNPVGQMQQVEKALLSAGIAAERVRAVADPAGQHREADWARRLPDALLWLSQ